MPRSRTAILPHPPLPPGHRVTRTPPGLATVVVASIAGVVAIVGIAAAWAGIAAITFSQCAWMAVVAALDAALLLRLANWPPGRARAMLAVAITAFTIVVGNALVATALIGRALGMRPYEALPGMSLELAALHARSNTGWIEGTWYVAALALAWRLGR
jgi:hypothetical protein